MHAHHGCPFVSRTPVLLANMTPCGNNKCTYWQEVPQFLNLCQQQSELVTLHHAFLADVGIALTSFTVHLYNYDNVNALLLLLLVRLCDFD